MLVTIGWSRSSGTWSTAEVIELTASLAPSINARVLLKPVGWVFTILGISDVTASINL